MEDPYNTIRYAHLALMMASLAIMLAMALF
jgi:hypothetical protein